jgi:hypothetical protein
MDLESIRPGPRAHRRLVSLLVVLVLALQAHVTILFLPRDRFPALRSIRPPRLWPFVDYPMFDAPHHVGDTYSAYRIVGIEADGSEVEIRGEDLGLGRWHFRKVRREIESLKRPAAVRAFADLYRRRGGRPLAGFRIEDHKWIFTPDGFVPGPVESVRQVMLHELEPSR